MITNICQAGYQTLQQNHISLSKKQMAESWVKILWGIVSLMFSLSTLSPDQWHIWGIAALNTHAGTLFLRKWESYPPPPSQNLLFLWVCIYVYFLLFFFVSPITNFRFLLFQHCGSKSVRYFWRRKTKPKWGQEMNVQV